jgi:hypothetical protein
MGNIWSDLNPKTDKGGFLRSVGAFLNPVAWVYSGINLLSGDKRDAYGKSDKTNKEFKEYSPPYFQKSYSAFDQLAPFIKVFVKIPLSDKEKANAKEQQVSFFDIPYNYIKSLKLETKTGDSNLDLVTLTLEDPSGTISAIMFAHLNMLATANGPVGAGIPEFILQYGWGGGNPFKIKTRGTSPLAYLETEIKEYTIKSADISYENMKQKMVLTANPKKMGVTYEFELQTKPYEYFGTATPLDDLIRNRFLFISKEIYLEKFKTQRVKDSGLESPNIDPNNIPIQSINNTEFYKQNNFLIKTIVNNNSKLFITKKVLKEKNNQYSDEDSNIGRNTKTSFDTLRMINYAKAKFHPYLVFCYYLSHYIDNITKNYPDKKIFVLPMYKEDKIFAWQNKYLPLDVTSFPTDWEVKFQEYLFSKGSNIVIPTNEQDRFEFENTEWLSRDNSIKDNTGWDEILLEIGKKVKLKIEKKEESPLEKLQPKPQASKAPPKKNKVDPIEYHTLHFQTINIPAQDMNKSISDNKVISERRAQTTKQIGILLKRTTKESPRIVTDFLHNMEKLVESTKNDILIIIINESGFSLKKADGNLPLQSYTVFPKIDITRKIGDTFFNAGSKNLKEESFPDVISFSPKIDFKNLVTVMVSQANNLNGDYYKNIPLISNTSSIISFLKNRQEEPNNTDEIFKFVPNSEDITSINNFFSNLKNIINNNKTYELNFPTWKKGWFIIDEPKNLICRTQTSANLIEKLNISNNKYEFKFDKLSKKESSDKELDDKKILEAIYADFIRFASVEKNKEMSGMISKAFDTTEDVFPGEPSSISYNKMIMQQKKFYEILKRSNYSFDAELKILGEPAYSFNWGSCPIIQLNVNAPDGTPNILCSGNYRIVGITQDIEGGKFTTTLQLKFEWETTNSKQD